MSLKYFTSEVSLLATITGVIFQELPLACASRCREHVSL